MMWNQEIEIAQQKVSINWNIFVEKLLIFYFFLYSHFTLFISIIIINSLRNLLQEKLYLAIIQRCCDVELLRFLTSTVLLWWIHTKEACGEGVTWPEIFCRSSLNEQLNDPFENKTTTNSLVVNGEIYYYAKGINSQKCRHMFRKDIMTSKSIQLW